MKTAYNGMPVPKGSRITWNGDNLVVPKDPIIPSFRGDGIGPELTSASHAIIDAAIALMYRDRHIVRFPLDASEDAFAKFGNYLPDDSLAAMADFVFSTKGPWGTPNSGGRESGTVRSRRANDLYQNIRPVFHIPGVPSNMKNADKVDVVLFRENMEGGYGGVEAAPNSERAKRVAKAFNEDGFSVPEEDTAMGLFIATKDGTKRIARAAIKFALDNNRKVVTIVAKSNIKKQSEGCFLTWAMEVAKEEFADAFISEADFKTKYNWQVPEGKLLVNHRIPDAMCAEIIRRPEIYSVLLCNNDFGDIISDLIAELTGGLAVHGGENAGKRAFLYEAIGGTADDIAGKGICNPMSLVMAETMMLRRMRWSKAADLVIAGLRKTVGDRTVTGDLASKMVRPKAKKVLNTNEFKDAVIANMKAIAAASAKSTSPRKCRATTGTCKCKCKKGAQA